MSLKDEILKSCKEVAAKSGKKVTITQGAPKVRGALGCEQVTARAYTFEDYKKLKDAGLID